MAFLHNSLVIYSEFVKEKPKKTMFIGILVVFLILVSYCLRDPSKVYVKTINFTLLWLHKLKSPEMTPSFASEK